MKQKVITILLTLAIVAPVQQVRADDEVKNMLITYYTPTSCPGTICYTGAAVRKGIAAVTEEHIGDAALIYTRDGEFIGYWECLDKIGTGKSTVIDIWVPDDETGKEIVRLTEGKVRVQFVDNPKG